MISKYNDNRGNDNESVNCIQTDNELTDNQMTKNQMTKNQMTDNHMTDNQMTDKQTNIQITNNHESDISDISSIQLTYRLLKEQGCDISYEKFIELRKYNYKYNFNKSNIICESMIPKCDYNHNNFSSISDNLIIVNNNVIKINPVHCVAPECKEDPHHTGLSLLSIMTYWCPICKIHSHSKIRCAEYCNNCNLHGPNCVFFKGDITCFAESCEFDPHHHIFRKQNHVFCNNCNMCHSKSLIFCNQCNKCFPSKLDQLSKTNTFPNETYHCNSIKCVEDPHHMTFQKKDHIQCSKCHECHEVNYINCDKCNKCHNISLKFCLSEISNGPFFPNEISKIIIELLDPNIMKTHLNYCSKCKNCEQGVHCLANECIIDPHHTRIKKRNHLLCIRCNCCHLESEDYVHCNKCYNCHPKSFKIFCNKCQSCIPFGYESNYHCLAKECICDPHHINPYKRSNNTKCFYNINDYDPVC